MPTGEVPSLDETQEISSKYSEEELMRVENRLRQQIAVLKERRDEHSERSAYHSDKAWECQHAIDRAKELLGESRGWYLGR